MTFTITLGRGISMPDAANAFSNDQFLFEKVIDPSVAVPGRAIQFLVCSSSLGPTHQRAVCVPHACHVSGRVVLNTPGYSDDTEWPALSVT